jgi:hypothetical protein
MGSQGDRSQEAEGRVMHRGTSDTDGGFFAATEDDFGDGLAEDLRARVKSELEPGERLLWAARSAPPPEPIAIWFVVLCAIGLMLLALGVGAVGHAVSYAGPVAVNETMPMGLALCGIGFIVILCTIGGRISEVSQRRREGNICYAMTDRRAISWIPETKGDAIRVHSLPWGRIRDVVRVQRPDGSGSLEFGLKNDHHHFVWQTQGLKHIPDVRRVEQIVRNHLTTPEQTS